MKTKIIAKAVVLNDAGEVLLLRRSPIDDRRPGEQDFPGGGVEPGEDLIAAVCREIAEEAGLHVEIHDITLFYGHTEVTHGSSVTRLVFWVRVSNPEVKLSFEHDDFHWVPAERASTEFHHYVYGRAVDYALEHRLFEN